MRTTDFPVRANSERNDFNREDSKSSNEAYKSFTKDRRARNNGGEGREALFSTTNRRNQQGGEQQIASRIAYNEIDVLLYFKDTRPDSQLDEIDSELLRLCDLYNVPVATNIATAEVVVTALDRGDLDWRNIANPKVQI